MLSLPKPNVTREQLHKFLKDPQILTLEILFTLLSIGHLFINYKLLTSICPFPVIVTWSQLIMGLLFAYIFGEFGTQFKEHAYFPRFILNKDQVKELLLPALMYLAMATSANVLLANTWSIATFPVVLSLAVTLHHVSRFFGCGQLYLPIRWIAIGLMTLGFIAGLFDGNNARLLPIALLYGATAAIFRAWMLEKAMHVVEGKGNVLHNNQVVIGAILLPFVALLLGEGRLFSHMPLNFTELYTWQSWGCLVAVGALPFVKNIVANRLIRKTGQAPWRVLELTSIILVLLLGALIYGHVSILGLSAVVLVISGRCLGSMDAISKLDNRPSVIDRSELVVEQRHEMIPEEDEIKVHSPDVQDENEPSDVVEEEVHGAAPHPLLAQYTRH